MRKRTLTTFIAVGLVLCCMAGATLAWLTDQTDEVKNTFTTSDVDIELAETTGNDYQMIPGYDIVKDPKVTVKAGSEKCYVFIELTEANEFDTYMSYALAAGWTALEGVDGVYYQIADDTDADQTFGVLAGDKVTVNGEVTKAQMDALTAETYPTLTVKAYACQYMKNNTESFTAAEAWNNL